MCQCVLCSCWWCDVGKPCCMGLGVGFCCFGIWCCKPDEIQSFHASSLICCEQTGFGTVCCCVAKICCAPEWLIQYSKKKSANEETGNNM